MTESEKIKAAIDMIDKHGGHDGDHHKAWCLDQVARILLGDKYKDHVTEIRVAGWEWDEGIAP